MISNSPLPEEGEGVTVKSPAVSRRVPPLAKIAGTLWVAIGLFGIWWSIVWKWAVLAFGHARDESSIPSQLFCFGFATVYVGVRIVRGKQRSLLLALVIALFFGALLAASLMSRWP